MIATWMAYALVVSGLLALAATVVERALRLDARPARGVWLAALGGSVLVPLLGWLAASRTTAAATRAGGAPGAPAEGTPFDLAFGMVQVIDWPGTVVQGVVELLGRLDPVLIGGWVAGSLALCAFLAVAQWRLALHRRQWRPTRIDGLPVLVSEGVGPAVVGFVRSAIVVPGWALAVERRMLDLMLAHEEEHLRAGDPRLLLAALALLALMPWNPVLWWQVRRLRLAVEVDCDARVLRRHPDRRAYGALLLELGQRRTTGSLAVVAAFSEPTTTLERRIRMITDRKPRNARVRAALLAGAGAMLLVAACETPAPTALAPKDGAVLYAAEGAEPVLDAAARQRDAVARYFPEVFTDGMGENAALAFVVGPDGEILEAHALPRREPSADRDPDRVLIRRDADGDAATIAVRRFEEPDFSALDVDPERTATVQVFRRPAGALGPDPVSTVWIQLRAEGDTGHAGHGGAPGSRPTMLSIVRPEGSVGAELQVEHREAGTVITGAAEPGERVGVLRLRPAGGTDVTRALFVVDGEVMPEGFSLETAGLSPDRIAQVDVLKGPAAVERFGARAEHGVVMIATKPSSPGARRP